MRTKSVYILIFLSLALILTSCSTKPEVSNNSDDNKEVISDKTSDETSIITNNNEDGLMDKIFLSLDGKYPSIDDIPLRKSDEVGSDGIERSYIRDYSYHGNELPNESNYDGLSVEEIIEKALEKVNENKELYFEVMEEGYINENGSTVESFQAKRNYMQDGTGRFQTILFDFIEGEIGATTYNGENYMSLIPEDFSDDDDLNLPPGLSSSEVWEILINRASSGYYDNQDNNEGDVVEANTIDELRTLNPKMVEPGLEASISLLKHFYNSEEGYFIRFRDGLSEAYGFRYENQNVYHVMYVLESEEDLSKADIQVSFFIDKDTNLVWIIGGNILEYNIQNSVVHYQEDMDYMFEDREFIIDETFIEELYSF